MFVALGIQFAMRIRHIVICSLLQNFSTLRHKRHDFRKKEKKNTYLKQKLFFLISFTVFVRNISHSKKNWAGCDKNVQWSSQEIPVILVRF